MMELRSTFNLAAADYETSRPGYPQALVDDVLSLSGIPARGEILEIGCGTGRATRLFAARGYRMVCLDLGRDLVEIARSALRDADDVTFILTEFEEYEPAGHTFDLIIAATSFHWIHAEAQYVRTAALLKPSGALAVFRHLHVGQDRGFFAEVQEIYKACAPSLVAPLAESDRSDQQIPGAGLYEPPIHREYPWSQEYTAGEYVRLLGTYSDHIALPGDERARLFREISKLIDEKYDGRILKEYVAVLDLRKKRNV
jgi:SAM-dependent methyltransferase